MELEVERQDGSKSYLISRSHNSLTELLYHFGDETRGNIKITGVEAVWSRVVAERRLE